MVLAASWRHGRFGEKGADALRRELREELGAEADVGPLLATIENVFTFEGEPGHEICLVYDSALHGEEFYSRDEWDAVEETADGVVVHKVAWKVVGSFDGELLYPEELLTLLR